MPDAFRAEFTGERVIPGRVEDNLFNEHLARYRFTARLAQALPGAVLDAGCGAGYGSAELAKSGQAVLGIDISEEAIAHAQAHYGEVSNLRFAQGSCTAIAAADAAFHLITAFEVIEHLADWRGFLAEARRVLDPGGLFLVSTPNRLYYAESREKAGPNPFHVHEFTEEEFRGELEAFFPQVKILLQNHVEGIAFSGDGMAGIEIADREADPAGAHFFLAVCGIGPLPAIAPFVFIPSSGNVLQTRERHIALLDGEILKKNRWIETEKAAQGRMEEKVRNLETELEEHNRRAREANVEAERRARLVSELQAELRRSNDWAQARDAEAVERGETIVQLQQQLERSNEWAQSRDAEAVERGRRVEQLQEEVSRATEWARSSDAEARQRGERIVALQDELERSNQWAQARDAEAEERGRRVVELQGEVSQAAEWARSSDAEARQRGERIVALQDELVREQANSVAAIEKLQVQLAESSAGYEAAITQWRLEKEAADRWAMDTERRLSAERDAAREAFAGKQVEFENAQERIAALTAEADQLRAQTAELRQRMEMIAQSRWVRLGRAVRVGPEIVS